MFGGSWSFGREPGFFGAGGCLKEPRASWDGAHCLPSWGSGSEMAEGSGVWLHEMSSKNQTKNSPRKLTAHQQLFPPTAVLPAQETVAKGQGEVVAEITPVQAGAPRQEGDPEGSWGGGPAVPRKPAEVGVLHGVPGPSLPSLWWKALEDARLTVGRRGKAWGGGPQPVLRPAASEVRSLALQALWTLSTSRSKRRASSEEGEYFQSLRGGGPGAGGPLTSSHGSSSPCAGRARSLVEVVLLLSLYVYFF